MKTNSETNPAHAGFPLYFFTFISILINVNEKQKRLLFILSIVVFIILINTTPNIILPLVIAGGFLFYIFKNKNKTNINNAKYTIPMNNTNISNFLNGVKHAGIIIFLGILGLILLSNMIVVVPAGQTGVYTIFGKVHDKEVHSGIHLVNPFASIEKMSIQTEQYTMSIAPKEGQRIGDDSIEALTKEGLKVHLDMTVLYHLKEDKASDVYRELGLRYDEKILRPEVRTAIRDVIALYEAKDIYSDKRNEAVQQIKESLVEKVGPRGIEIESVLLRNVALPQMLTTAIESKLTAEQEAQRYDFVLQREEKEAERKRIEAKGQRDAQSIINQSLTDRYLQYLYVQNLENRKGTIYVPYNMPLFKNF